MSQNKTDGFGEDVDAILAELNAEIDEEPGSAPRRRLPMASDPVPAPTPPAVAPMPLAGERQVVEAPLLADEAVEEVPEGVIAIKARVSADEQECLIMVSEPVLEGRSWWFGDASAASNSTLANAIFDLDGIETLLIDGSNLTVSRAPYVWDDWAPKAAEIGRIIREQIQAGGELVASDLLARIPSEEEIENLIQSVLDTEVNPGVAAHSGHISLERVRGNSVYIRMGGGCQGCSVADVTLKQGIHAAFRAAVPEVGGIYDETDHAAGENPYFT